MNDKQIYEAVIKTAKQLSNTTTNNNDRILKKNTSLKAIRRLLINLNYKGCPITLEEQYYKQWSN